MNWKQYIDSDPNILSGKPIIKGTRISVEFILDLFSKGWTREQVIENYPSLSEESLNAIFSFTVETIQEDYLYFLKKGAA